MFKTTPRYSDYAEPLCLSDRKCAGSPITIYLDLDKLSVRSNNLNYELSCHALNKISLGNSSQFHVFVDDPSRNPPADPHAREALQEGRGSARGENRSISEDVIRRR